MALFLFLQSEVWNLPHNIQETSKPGFNLLCSLYFLLFPDNCLATALKLSQCPKQTWALTLCTLAQGAKGKSLRCISTVISGTPSPRQATAGE